MSYIQHGETQYPLQPGEIRIGSGPDAGIRIAGLGGPVGGLEGGDHLVLRVTAADEVVIRRSAAGPPVRVNGVELGSEPTPLIHGDKIEVAGHELLFGDERKSGGTQFLPGLRVPSGSAPGEPRAARTSGRASGTTGGRLVSLTDGREYAIAAGGLTLGRDAGNDVVIPSTEASRRHAVISLQGDGYVLGDRSTNGVFVNGDRVQSVRLLGRGDVIRIGNEEFRFYADAPAAPTAPAAPAAPATRATPATPATPAPTSPPPVASMPGAGADQPPVIAESPDPPGVGAQPAGASVGRPVLATLEIVNEGVHKGRRHDLTLPLIHVGRGAHNDVVIADESVSDSHAKLQRRGGGWFVVDMGSTNGTYVGGRRIVGEERLAGAADVRFGGIKMLFRSAAEPDDPAKGTRAIAGVRVPPRHDPAGSAQRASRRPAGEPPPRAIPGWLWLAAVALLAGAAYFIIRAA